ncbi:hypothetical protein [Thermoanaerobacterium sp. RBIITD]|uniref:hypothetical protein n=1 Tax=Thermoanaerobacterium sp. RBIITD TaxID=1550240 RepID=UPI000BB838BC|nr:hypothetical protein [Thermoanaerobacterium sp. RBIITD]SNX52626.1 hypothetical protein SAMN05660242_0031 [Thermoanaerobacterium sp. RBIITD]
MLKRRMLIVYIISTMLALSIGISAKAFQKESMALNDTHSKINIDAGSYRELEDGIKVYTDTLGGIVLHFAGTKEITKEEVDKGKKILENQDTEKSAMEKDLEVRKNNPDNYTMISGNYYDIEYYPIYIGTWGNVDVYARHTIGTRSTYNGQDYLTSYGDVTWYNTSGYNALPYRNGNATVPNQKVVDVAQPVLFNIRDLGTNRAKEITRNDFGPNQVGIATRRIADLDKYIFNDLHGNTSDGVFYSRTFVPLTNYNPEP